MDPQDILNQVAGANIVPLLLALFIIISIFLGVRIVPQSEKHVVERFGRLQKVLGPGINFIVPFLDRVRHKISILERQLPTASQDAITKDNVLVQVETSVFYRILEPEKTVYRIRDVDAAIDGEAFRWVGIRRVAAGLLVPDVDIRIAVVVQRVDQHDAEADDYVVAVPDHVRIRRVRVL